MNVQALIDTSKMLFADDKGLLPMDESTGTCNKRFAALGIRQTEEARRSWREFLITTPGLGRSINGAIECNELSVQGSRTVGAGVLVCPCNPAACDGNLGRRRSEGGGGSGGAVAPRTVQPGSTAGRIQCSNEGSAGMITEASLPLRIHIFRHGETEWSLTGQHTGRTDLPLTAGGVDKARSLGQSLEGIQFAHVLTSPRQRARKTCEMADLQLTAGIDADLAEWDYGDYEGQTSASIVLQRPGWNLYRDGCPHGESPEQVSERADRLIARLRTLEGNVALFSHGQFSAVLAVRWIGMPVAVAQHFPLGTASHSILGSALHHPQVSVIEQWNVAPCASCLKPVKRSAIER